MGTNDTKRERAADRESPAPIDASRLFQGHREIAIVFRGDTYRLRITRNDKLILTK